MGVTKKSVRQSVSLPARLATRVKSLARSQRKSANQVLVDLVESGLESKEREKERFFALTHRLTGCKDSAEREHVKKELARMTFGE